MNWSCLFRQQQDISFWWFWKFNVPRVTSGLLARYQCQPVCIDDNDQVSLIHELLLSIQIDFWVLKIEDVFDFEPYHTQCLNASKVESDSPIDNSNNNIRYPVRTHMLTCNKIGWKKNIIIIIICGCGILGICTVYIGLYSTLYIYHSHTPYNQQRNTNNNSSIIHSIWKMKKKQYNK